MVERGRSPTPELTNMGELKDGGFKDGPWRKPRREPTPARRIPWPEVSAVLHCNSMLGAPGLAHRYIDLQPSHIPHRRPHEDAGHGSKAYSCRI